MKLRKHQNGSESVPNEELPQKTSSVCIETDTAQQRNVILVIASLILVSFVLYWPIVGFGFIDYDDPDYITNNYFVRQGITLEGIKWAFSHTFANNWHPITWLSHMVDVELFGLKPSGHHFVNILLHTTNSVLVFLCFRKMTGLMWRSAVVAALFAWHPLHIQSVAWAAERKDVLSTLFALLTIFYYAAFVDEFRKENANLARRQLRFSLLFFAFGLMAKPMLVTLPVLLLFLDLWPFKRVTNPALLREKAPFIALSVASILITLLAQQEAIGTLKLYPLSLRLANAPVATVSYIAKMFWPVNLAIFYPYPSSVSGIEFVAAICIVLAITILAVVLRIRFPQFLTGWLWFLVGLVPVIGIVQVGAQSMADRYTYVPIVGLFILLVWLIAEKLPRAAAIAIGVIAIVGSIGLTRYQLQFWKDDIALFERAVVVTGANPVAIGHLASSLAQAGRVEDGIRHYEDAIRKYPANFELRNNFGQFLARQQKFDKAVEHFQEVIRLNPSYGRAYANLGAILLTVGKQDEGKHYLNEALRIAPDDGDVQFNIANVLLAERRELDALPYYLEAARLEPGNAEANYRAGKILLRTDVQRSIPYLKAAIDLKPDWISALTELAWLRATDARAQVRDSNEAVRLAERAAALTQFADAKTLSVLDAAYAEAGRFEDALRVAENARQTAAKGNQFELAKAAEYRLSLYQRNAPFRQQ